MKDPWDNEYRITYLDYFGVMRERVFYAPDEVSAKRMCSRTAKNCNAPVYEYVKVEKL